MVPAQPPHGTVERLSVAAIRLAARGKEDTICDEPVILDKERVKLRSWI